ncbi:unnamed protein product [Cuscuta campestris]|uniref:Retrotransposon gag domain-containing protein n=1 Tax=Cuscuta campestris TaxID=132261 RepID=A0A484K6C7_9ASTE|nr:unnamed protein product [Cuscuta campestris]
MKNALRAKRKLGFIDGTQTLSPAAAPHDVDAWISVNSMVQGWIMTSLDASIRSTVSFMDTTRALWLDVKGRFSVSDGVCLYQLKEQIRNTRQQGSFVTVYYGRLRGLWDELDGHLIIPKCICQKCTCDLEKNFWAQREIEKVHEFLLGLDEAVFGTVRSQILGASPTPSLAFTYNRIVGEEHHHHVSRDHDARSEIASFGMTMSPPSPATAAAVHKSSGNRALPTGDQRGSFPGGRFCTHCSRSGHEIETCFLLHGFPDTWNKPKGRGGGSSGGRGRGGGSRGGRGNNRPPAIAAAGQTIASEGPESGSSTSSFPNMSAEQWSQLSTFLAQFKNNGDTLSASRTPSSTQSDTPHPAIFDPLPELLPDQQELCTEPVLSPPVPTVSSPDSVLPSVATPDSAPTQPPVSAQPSAMDQGRPQRTRRTPAWHTDYVCTNTVSHIDSPSSTVTPSKSSDTPYPIHKFVTCSAFSASHQTFTAALDNECEPTGYRKALQDPRWYKGFVGAIDASPVPTSYREAVSFSLSYVVKIPTL